MLVALVLIIIVIIIVKRGLDGNRAKRDAHGGQSLPIRSRRTKPVSLDDQILRRLSNRPSGIMSERDLGDLASDPLLLASAFARLEQGGLVTSRTAWKDTCSEYTITQRGRQKISGYDYRR